MIQKLIKKIGVDKLLHFLCGMIIALISLIIFKSFITAIVLTAWIGAAKEIFDMRKNDNKFDVLDLIFTIVGGLLGAAFFVFL